MNKLVIYALLVSSVCYLEGFGAEQLTGSYPETPSQKLSAETHAAPAIAQKEALARIQMPFIKNEGQVKPDDIKFYVQTFNGTVFVTGKGELLYTITETKDYLGVEDYLLTDGSFSGRYSFSLKETPITDNLPQITGMESSPTVVNYFIGDNPKDWRSNIQTYNLISLGEVWPGITVNLKANSKNIEKLFIINPEGTPASIMFSIDGTEELSLTQTGELKIKTQRKSIGFTHPIAYQEINGARKPVEVSFRLIDKATYGFMVGDYDKTIPLVIDPLLSSTFVGGFGQDTARALVIDPVNGNVFVTGSTQGVATFVWGLGWIYPNNFPTQGETPLAAYNNGSTPTYNGAYIGGAGGTGFLNPPPGGGPSDIFICKLNPTLTTLIASTFLGGPNADAALGIALDTQGNVFVCGTAQPGFPIIRGRTDATSFSEIWNGSSVLGNSVNPNDAFIAKLSNSLSGLLASTYWGGSANGSLTADSFTSIAVDGSNNVFVCGYTDGSNAQVTGGITYPSGSSSVQYNGGVDAFVAKFNNNLSGRIASRPTDFYFAGVFLGGSPSQSGPGFDTAFALCLNSLEDQANIYVTGVTTIGSPFFPVVGDGLVDAYDRAIDGAGDAFVCRFSNDLRTLRSSTFLGRIGAEVGYGIAMGPPIAGEATVYVTGITDSPLFPVTSFGYPVPDPLQSWNPYNTVQPGLGSQDVFVTRLTGNLTGLVNSTWIGGVDTETSYSVCVGGSNNNVYICGVTQSSDFPTTPDAFGITNTGGAGDVFVCCFNETLSILNAATLIGGQFLETAYVIRPDNTGNIVFAGIAGDNVYPTWPTTGTDIAYDTSYNGSGDVFVTRVTNDLSGGFSTQPQPTGPPGEAASEGEGIIAGSSAIAYLDANAFKQGCFIATAVYGNQKHPNVITLRNFRDKYLLTNKLGSKFVDWYYRTSPPVAEYLKHTPLQASAVRCALAPIVYTIRYPILMPTICALLLALGYWMRRRYTKHLPAV